MNNLNYEFFDEFKKLDTLCKDIYGKDANNRLGVTLYIEDMEKHDNIGRIKIPSWTNDYHRLKHIRHIRNELAHSNVSFSSNLCTQSDLEFTRSFYLKMLDRSDPISILRKQHGYYQSGNTSPRPPHSSHTSRRFRVRPYVIKYISRKAGCLTLTLPFLLVSILAVVFLTYIVF